MLKAQSYLGFSLAAPAKCVHIRGVIRRVLWLMVISMVLGHAQDAGAPQKSRALRLLPLGEPPPFRQDVRDGVRYELEPDPGSIPPRQIRLGGGDSATLVRLNLGRASESLHIPSGTAPVAFREASAPDDPTVKPWLTLYPPATGNVIAVIWRDPGSRWNLPKNRVLDDSAAALPAGSLRIVNLLPVDAALIFGDDRLILTPGKVLVKAISIGTDLPIQIAYKTPTGQLQAFYSGAVMLNPNERAQIFIHRADSEKPRRPAKVVIFNETAPPPPKPQP
ncbi:MAG: hypothetical protein WCP35_15650 [Verrucomicrobiota bacterium]